MEEKVKRYEKLINEMVNVSEKYLGSFSVRLLFERIIWELSMEYKEMEMIHYGENGVVLEGIMDSLKLNTDIPIDDMFGALISKYVEILAKLIGRESVEKIKKMIEIPLDLEGGNKE